MMKKSEEETRLWLAGRANRLWCQNPPSDAATFKPEDCSQFNHSSFHFFFFFLVHSISISFFFYLNFSPLLQNTTFLTFVSLASAAKQAYSFI